MTSTSYENIRTLAEEKAEDRLLDLMVPPLPRRLQSDAGLGDLGLDDLRSTREKFRGRLKSGALDHRRIEIEAFPPDEEEQRGDIKPIIRRLANEALQKISDDGREVNFDAFIKEVFGDARTLAPGLIPGRKRRTVVRTISVSEARVRFVDEELAKLALRDTEKDYESSLYVPSQELVIVQNSLLDLVRDRPAMLDEISHRQFEELLLELLTDRGFQVELTATTRDGGCDLIAVTQDRLGIKTKYVVEAKHYRRSNKVGVGAIRQLSAVRQRLAAHHGLLVTTSYFSEDATKENSFYGLHLRDYDRLLDWLRT